MSNDVVGASVAVTLTAGDAEVSFGAESAMLREQWDVVRDMDGVDVLPGPAAKVLEVRSMWMSDADRVRLMRMLRERLAASVRRGPALDTVMWLSPCWITKFTSELRRDERKVAELSAGAWIQRTIVTEGWVVDLTLEAP